MSGDDKLKLISKMAATMSQNHTGSPRQIAMTAIQLFEAVEQELNEAAQAGANPAPHGSGPIAREPFGG